MIKFLVILKIPFVGVISTHKILPGLINVIQTQDDFCNFYERHEICNLGIKSYIILLHKNKTGNVIFI